MSHKREEMLEEKISPGIHKRIMKLEKMLEKMMVEHHKMKHHSMPHHSKMAHHSMAAHHGKIPKLAKVLGEFKLHELHSGSKKGPLVRSRKQALAIGLSEARKAGQLSGYKKRK